MIATFQSKLHLLDGIHNGNCFAACLASVMEIPLWMVPPFEDMFARDDWRIRSNEWALRMFGGRFVRTNGHESENMPEFYIANGLSARKVYHSVIYSDGVLVHDPHPSHAGIENVEWTYHFAKEAA